MRVAWIQGCSVMVAAALALLLGSPLRAADQTGVRTAAEELGSRTKATDAPAGAPKGLSDSAVRVMSTFALSILPDQVPDGTGGKMKLDKSDPNKYLIPLDDARGVIKVATRSAYAEACNLPELEKSNFDALMRNEQARLVWSTEQMLFIQALHTFATSYFAGNVKITEQPDDPAAAKDAPAKGERRRRRSQACRAGGDHYGQEAPLLAGAKGEGNPGDWRLRGGRGSAGHSGRASGRGPGGGSDPAPGRASGRNACASARRRQLTLSKHCV